MRKLTIGMLLLLSLPGLAACDIFIQDKPDTVVIDDNQPDVVVIEDQTPDAPAPPPDVNVNIDNSDKGESGGGG